MTEPTSPDVLTINFADDGAIVVVGEIDMAGGPLLEAALRQREDDDDLILDLNGVTFIDSSGLRSLLEANRRQRERNGRLVLRGVGPEVSRLLEITGTESQFEIFRR